MQPLMDGMRHGFTSPTYGRLTLESTLKVMESFRAQSPESEYRLLVGTDSLGTQHRTTVAFITAIVFQRVGNGAIYFWQRLRVDHIFTLRQRMTREAQASIDVATILLNAVPANRRDPLSDIEIHLDLGERGPTKELIREIVGMVRAYGFEVRTKPDAVAASKVADRHTVLV